MKLRSGWSRQALQEVADIADNELVETKRAAKNIPAWDPAWAQVEIEHFRTLWDWGCFTQLLAKKLCTSPRRALSAHTTTACQPKKADGPGGSLKDVGMDDILPAVGGQFFVCVNLPHAFSYGDGLAVTYVSTAEKDAKAVQNQACLELLCYLVVSAPGRVRLPPGCFVQGGVDIDDFRAKAIEFSQQVGFTEQSLAWQIPEIHAGQPLAALAAFVQHAGPGQPLAAMQPIAPPPAAAGPIEPAVGGDEAVLEILRSLRINTEYQTAKRRIPTAIGKQLEPVLRKHGLLPFLQRYPQYFDVTLTGGVTSNKKPQYTFKMKAAINDVAAIQPAVGGGAAVAAPAVGGLAPAIGAGGGGGCHPGNSGDGAAPAAPAAAPAIGAGAGGDSSGDGAAAAAEEPFPEAEIAAAMIADGFKQYHMAAPTAAALPAVGGHESPMEPAVPPPAPAPSPMVLPSAFTMAPVGGDDDDERSSNRSEVVASSSLPAVAVGNNTVPGASSSLPAVGNNTVPGASSSLPVVGGNQTPHGIMSDWDVNGMVSLLESISLGHLSKAFVENGLDGAFFLQCSQEELAEIGLTALQFKKIMAYAPGGPKNQ